MPLLRNGYPGVLEVRLLPRNRVPRFPPTHLYDEVGAPILYSCCGPLGVSAHHRHPDPTLAVYRAESGGANRILKEAKWRSHRIQRQCRSTLTRCTPSSCGGAVSALQISETIETVILLYCTKHQPLCATDCCSNLSMPRQGIESRTR